MPEHRRPNSDRSPCPCSGHFHLFFGRFGLSWVVLDCFRPFGWIPGRHRHSRGLQALAGAIPSGNNHQTKMRYSAERVPSEDQSGPRSLRYSHFSPICPVPQGLTQGPSTAPSRPHSGPTGSVCLSFPCLWTQDLVGPRAAGGRWRRSFGRSSPVLAPAGRSADLGPERCEAERDHKRSQKVA